MALFAVCTDGVNFGSEVLQFSRFVLPHPSKNKKQVYVPAVCRFFCSCLLWVAPLQCICFLKLILGQLYPIDLPGGSETRNSLRANPMVTGHRAGTVPVHRKHRCFRLPGTPPTCISNCAEDGRLLSASSISVLCCWVGFYSVPTLQCL